MTGVVWLRVFPMNALRSGIEVVEQGVFAFWHPRNPPTEERWVLAFDATRETRRRTFQ
jgi:hypothetical protein